MRTGPKEIRVPGDDESDVDEAIELGRQGQARRIVKPKPQVPESSVHGDPERPPEAAVNAQEEMSYAEAMAKVSRGELKRRVLTELGWVIP